MQFSTSQMNSKNLFDNLSKIYSDLNNGINRGTNLLQRISLMRIKLTSKSNEINSFEEFNDLNRENENYRSKIHEILIYNGTRATSSNFQSNEEITNLKNRIKNLIKENKYILGKTSDLIKEMESLIPEYSAQKKPLILSPQKHPSVRLINNTMPSKNRSLLPKIPFRLRSSPVKLIDPRNNSTPIHRKNGEKLPNSTTKASENAPLSGHQTNFIVIKRPPFPINSLLKLVDITERKKPCEPTKRPLTNLDPPK